MRALAWPALLVVLLAGCSDWEELSSAYGVDLSGTPPRDLATGELPGPADLERSADLAPAPVDLSVPPSDQGPEDLAVEGRDLDEPAADLAGLADLADLMAPADLEKADLARSPRVSASRVVAVGQPRDVVLRDVNRDGRLDAVVASETGVVAVLGGNGDGSFRAPVTSAAGPTPYALVAVDSVGHGCIDVVTANYGESSVSGLLGTGSGLGAGVEFRVVHGNGVGHAANPIALAAADLNHNGLVDVVTADWTDGTVAVLDNVGQGGAMASLGWKLVNSIKVADQLRTIAIADFNRDGTPDLVVGRNAGDGSDSVQVLLGSGGENFQAPSVSGTGGPVNLLAVGDLDGDGRLDVVTAEVRGQQVCALLGKGTGLFQAARCFAAGGDAFAVALADLDRDGKLDAAVTLSAADQVALLPGNGDGTFGAADLYAVGRTPVAITAGDVNGDGAVDLVTANNGSGDLTVLLSTAAAPRALSFKKSVEYAGGMSPRAILVGDLDRNGTPDVATADSGGADVGVMAGGGDGTLGAAEHYASGRASGAIAGADLNRDGVLDLVAANALANDFTVHLGKADGTLQAAVAYPTDSGPSGLCTGDFAGTGTPGVAVANATTGSLQIFAGKGDGTLTKAQSVTLLAGARAVAAGDLDRDGRLDWVVGNDQTATVTVLLNKGDGTVAALPLPVAYPSLGGATAVTLADVDRDGALDVIAASADQGVIAVLLGKGDGTLKKAVSYAAGMAPSGLAVGDLDGDGRPDVVVAARDGDSAGVLLGQGDGTFGAVVLFSVGGAPVDVRAADANGDGLLDLVVANSQTSNVSVLVNSSR